MCQLIYISDFGNLHSPALSILESIDPSHQLALKSLVQLTNTTWDQDELIYATENLERLAPGNRIAQEKLDELIATVLRSMQTLKADDETCLFNPALYWRGMRRSNLMPEVVTAFKPYLSEWCCKHTPTN